MKNEIGKKILISSPIILILYIFINDFIYKFPNYVFNLILLYAALGLFLLLPNKEKK